jgi:hypothetical protein
MLDTVVGATLADMGCDFGPGDLRTHPHPHRCGLMRITRDTGSGVGGKLAPPQLCEMFH